MPKTPNFEIKMSLYQARKTWEHFHKKLFPETLAYKDALKSLWRQFGYKILDVAHKYEDPFSDDFLSS